MGESLCSWVDVHLQPLIAMSPGYLQDTKHVVTLLWDVGPPMLDIQRYIGLYPSIPHNLALLDLSEYLKRFNVYSAEVNEFILAAAELLFKNNYFMFHGQFFLQTCGASIGAKFSPAMAYIFMAIWVEHFLFSDNNPFASHIR